MLGCHALSPFAAICAGAWRVCGRLFGHLQNKYGESALMFAARNQPEAVAPLIAAGANVDLQVGVGSGSERGRG